MPAFDAKGIETVRRDTCGAVAKMMERSIRILFSTKDLSQVLQLALWSAPSPVTKHCAISTELLGAPSSCVSSFKKLALDIDCCMPNLVNLEQQVPAQYT